MFQCWWTVLTSTFYLSQYFFLFIQTSDFLLMHFLWREVWKFFFTKSPIRLHYLWFTILKFSSLIVLTVMVFKQILISKIRIKTFYNMSWWVRLPSLLLYFQYFSIVMFVFFCIFWMHHKWRMLPIGIINCSL